VTYNCQCICVKELRVTTRNLGQDNRSQLVIRSPDLLNTKHDCDLAVKLFTATEITSLIQLMGSLYLEGLNLLLCRYCIYRKSGSCFVLYFDDTTVTH